MFNQQQDEMGGVEKYKEVLGDSSMTW